MKNKWVLTVLMVAMLLYQAWRVQDYMRNSLAGVSEDAAFWVSMAFLAFTEIGLLAWLHVAQPGATTNKQESVSTVMIWADYAGSMILGLADLAVRNTIYDINLSRIDPLLFFAPWVIVVLNIGGWIVYKSNDSEEILERSKRRLNHVEVESKIHVQEEAIKRVVANRDAQARQLAPLYERDIQERVARETAAKLGVNGDGIDFTMPAPHPAPKARKSGVKGFVNRLWNGDDDDIMRVPEVSTNGNRHEYNTEADTANFPNR